MVMDEDELMHGPKTSARKPRVSRGRQKWEYAAFKKRLGVVDLHDEHMLAWLNRLGAHGWESVHLYAIGGVGGRIIWHGVFKREIR